MSRKKSEKSYDCANHFTPDSLTNKGHFKDGFLQKLILKEGLILEMHDIIGFSYQIQNKGLKC